MDPRERPHPLPDGAACTACGVLVPNGRIRIVARRDDVAFVELACPACGSAGVGLLVAAGHGQDGWRLDGAGDDPASGNDAARTLRPITAADVEAIRDDLAAWQGDLKGWLETLTGPAPGGTGGDA